MVHCLHVAGHLSRAQTANSQDPSSIIPNDSQSGSSLQSSLVVSSSPSPLSCTGLVSLFISFVAVFSLTTTSLVHLPHVTGQRSKAQGANSQVPSSTIPSSLQSLLSSHCCCCDTSVVVGTSYSASSSSADKYIPIIRKKSGKHFFAVVMFFHR